jgi:hypothetical protein
MESPPDSKLPEGFELPKLLGGKRQKKQQQQKQQGGSHLAFSELKGGKRSRKQQQKQLQEGGALAFSELKGGAALSPSDFMGGESPKQCGGRKRRSAKKSHRRRSGKRSTMKSMVKGLFGIFKKK